MRWVLLAVLIAIPVALAGWVRWVAVHEAPAEFIPPPATAEVALAASPTAATSPGAQPTATPALAPAVPLALAVEDAERGLRALFATPNAGLAQRGAPVFYDGESLFEAIDGAAPIFLERKFRRLMSVELATPGANELTCDVYDMSDAEHARSIFEKERSAQAKVPEGWTEALAGPMSFVFQQGRFYVKLTAFDAAAEQALPKLAAALREKIR